MKKFLFILVLLPLSLSAQTSSTEEYQIDSLNQVIATAKLDTSIIKAWQTLDKLIARDSIELSIALNHKIDSLCTNRLNGSLTEVEKSYFLEKKGIAMNSLGLNYNKNGEYSEAISYHEKGLAIWESTGNELGMAKSYNNLGMVYHNLSNISTSIKYYTEALLIKERLGDDIGAARTLNHIGVVYAYQNLPEKALEYFTKSLTLRLEIDDQRGIANSYNSLGIINQDLKNYSMSLEYYEKSLKIKSEIGNERGVSNTLNNIASVYLDLGKYELSLENFEKSVDIKRGFGDSLGVSNGLNNIGKVYFHLGDYKKANKLFNRAYSMAKDKGIIGLEREITNQLWANYKELGEFEKALEMYEEFVMIQDSIFSDQNRDELLNQQFKYNYDKKEAVATAEHAVELKRQEDASIAEQKEQDFIILVVSAGSILLLLFLVFVFNRLRITRKQKNKIGKQKEVIEAAHKETEKQKHLIEETHREITDSINYAQRLQDAILPSFEEVTEKLPNNFILFKPKDVVSGDFYWFEHLNGISYLAVADCTGHGVPGAMVSVVCSNALNRSVKEFGITEPSKILDKTRELVIETFAKSGEDVKDGMDIALCAFKGNKVVYSGANNPLWIVRNTVLLTEQQKEHKSTISEDLSDGKEDGLSLVEYKADKQPIGLYAGMKDFTQTEIELHPNDSLYFFTDGFADQFGGERGKKFMYKPFKRLLIDLHTKPMTSQSQLISDAFENWRGELEQIDDVCVIGVRI